jgi:RNA polymerase sigma factor (sigma-70 family)
MDETAFGEFFHSVEPPVRRTLVAWYGPALGRDAAQAALEWAWQHRDRLDRIGNPAGYLFRVGQSHAKRELRRSALLTSAESVPDAVEDDPRFEPGLASAIAALSDRQRAAVVLVHGYGYSFRETADALDVSLASVRTHVDRGLRRLRTTLEVHDGTSPV